MNKVVILTSRQPHPGIIHTRDTPAPRGGNIALCYFWISFTYCATFVDVISIDLLLEI